MTRKKTSQKYKIDARKWPGVFGYDSDKKTVQGKPDVCYYIAYRRGKRLTWEKIGWKSEGYTPQIASEKRSEKLREYRHTGSVKTDKEIAREKIKTDRTLNEISDTYFESDRGKKLKGRKTDINRFDLHLKPVIGKRRISSLVELDIDRIKIKMKGKAPATVSNVLELLRRLVNYGAKNNLCPPLPFVVEMPAKNNERIEYLTPGEAKRLTDVLNGWKRQDVARMLKLAMVTGLRRGEIFKLEDRDLKFSEKIIILRDPKGTKDQSVPMNKAAAEILKQQIEWRDKWSEKREITTPFIFPGVAGGQRVDCSAVDRIKKKAKLPKGFRIFHGLRHHFGVTLANSGEFSLDMIGELLTHKSLAMTKRYSQFLPGTKKAASEKAAKLIQAHIDTHSDDQIKVAENG
jgi:integrase